MKMKIEDKIKPFDELLEIVSRFKNEGKKVVQSHGIFDIIHPGIIRHIESSRAQGDVLIVTVVKDSDVKKGPGYPIFNERLRAENAASLESVDFVSIVKDQVSYECLRLLKPDVFAKGQDESEKDQEVIKRIKEEEDLVKVAGCKIHYSTERAFSSTSIINQFLDIYPEPTRDYIRAFKKKYSAHDVINGLRSLEDMKVLVLGDTIIDEYHYCESMAKSLKDNLVVNRYIDEEIFAGGILAVANHVSGLCRNVKLISVLGKEDSKENFIISKLRPQIEHKFFYRDSTPTIIKRRFIDRYLNKRLFEICYMNDDKITEKQEKPIIKYLTQQIDNYDLILVGDFGHGMISKNLISLLESRAKRLVVNVQTNGANMGYNMITKYKRINFACIDEPEARLATQNKWGDIMDVSSILSKQINAELMIITRGKIGSVGIDGKGNYYLTPAFASKVIDRLGAGDAFLAFTAPCFAKRLPYDMISFVGNVVGALAVQIVGNKEPVAPSNLYEFIYTLLR